MKLKTEEVKLCKLSKEKIEAITNQFKNSVIYVVSHITEDKKITDENIIGRVTHLSPLNNKTIVRIKPISYAKAGNYAYELLYSVADGFFVKAKDL